MVWYIIAAIMVLVLLTVAWPFYTLHRQRAKLPKTWIHLGTPPKYADEALGIIRLAAVDVFGPKVQELRWGGFIEWAATEDSKVVDWTVPILRVRWERCVEDTFLAATFGSWIALRLDAPDIRGKSSRFLTFIRRVRADLVQLFGADEERKVSAVAYVAARAYSQEEVTAATGERP